MTQFQVIVLSILQGLAEFLPISSSGHLILVSKFTNFPDQGIELDTAVHVGSIIAIILYFHKDIFAMIKDVFATKFIPNLRTYGSKFFWLVIIATIPAIVFGLCLHSYGTEWLRSTKIIGWNIIIFGIILWWADTRFSSKRGIQDFKVRDAILIGLAQCMALIPGTSRSGITITMARILGVNRREAAKFSMVLSIPVIIGAGLIAGYSLYKREEWTSMYYALSGVGYSFVASILVIFFMMNWLKKYSFLPFVIYRVVLGLFLLLYSYGYLS